MSRTLIRGGRLLCPATGLDTQATLILEGDRILRIVHPDRGEPEPAFVDLTVDAGGALVLPGLVDLHAHLCEPGEEHKEDLESAGRAALRGGFTTVVAGSRTTPVNDHRAVTELLVRRSAELALCRVLPMGALTAGCGGARLAEMFELRAAGAVALGDAGATLADAGLLRRAFEYARAVELPVFEVPEDASLAGRGVMHEGPVSTRLGLAGIPAAAEEIAVGRALALCALTGVRLHLGPISAAASVEAIRRAKAAGLPVTCAVTAAHLALTDEAVAAAYSPMLRLSPPLRGSADREALRRGVADGTIDAIASGHRPQSPVEKDVEFDLAEPGAIGLETTLPVVLKLVSEGQLPLMPALAALTAGPARALGPAHAVPSLTPGARADVIVVDAERRTRLTPARLESRSHNTPFLGQALPGAVLHAFVGGRHHPQDIGEVP